MAGAAWTYWLWWAGSVGVGVLLLAVGIWGLYAGRARGRMCPRCLYDLSGTDEARCPECGYELPRGKRLRARPRHPWIGLTSLLLLNVGIALLTYRQFHSSWRDMVPDRVLLLMLPLSTGANDWLWQETQARIVAREFSESEQRMLVNRCIAGDWWARPASEPWRASYGDLLRIWRETKPAPELLDELYALPVHVELVSRKHWPEGTEICVQARVDDWWPLGMEIRLTAEPAIEGVAPVTFIRTGSYMPASRFALFVPAMPAGEHTISYTVQLERRRMNAKSTWKDAGTAQDSVQISVAWTMDDVLPAAEERVLDEVIAGLFSIGVARWESGTSPVRVYFEPEHTFTPAFQDVAIGASVRILYDGKLVRSMNLWWLGGPQKSSPEAWNLGWETPWEDRETLTTAPADDKWSVQVVALQHVALRVIGAKRYWEGAVTVPTEVFERKGEAPPVPWRRDD